MTCHGEDNPYLLFFLHLERYGMIGQFTSGDLSFSRVREMAAHRGLSENLLWRLAVAAYHPALAALDKAGEEGGGAP